MPGTRVCPRESEDLFLRRFRYRSVLVATVYKGGGIVPPHPRRDAGMAGMYGGLWPCRPVNMVQGHPRRNHSGRPGDRVWPRFPLILGSGGAQNGVGGFPSLPTSIFRFFLNGCVQLLGKCLPRSNWTSIWSHWQKIKGGRAEKPPARPARKNVENKKSLITATGGNSCTASEVIEIRYWARSAPCPAT